MFGKKKILFLALFWCLFSWTAPISHIVLDLGGVLVRTSGIRTFKQVGIVTMLRQAYTNGLDPVETKKRLYELLTLVDEQVTIPLYDDEGLLLPPLMVQWLLGQEKNSILRKQILHAFAQHPEWFTNKAESDFMHAMARMIFTTSSFINTRSLVCETVQFIKECKANGYKLIVLSNWDKQSFKPLCKKFNSVFCLFDELICSGNVGSAKPYMPVYQKVFQLAHPENCVLIDDQKENIKAAQMLGMQTIHVKKKKKMIGALPDIEQVKKEFSQLSSATKSIAAT